LTVSLPNVLLNRWNETVVFDPKSVGSTPLPGNSKHGTCGQTLELKQISPIASALRCSNCGLRVEFSNTITTCQQLIDHFGSG